ncbi:MAG: hypothetical protein M3R48_00815 [Candidatus Dormibacteraeota bacterium]|nr:hypothetical protein [Candidatus Dormibacteraeota bacterium]
MNHQQRPAVAELALIAGGFAVATIATVTYSALLWSTRGALRLVGLDRAQPAT